MASKREEVSSALRSDGMARMRDLEQALLYVLVF